MSKFELLNKLISQLIERRSCFKEGSSEYSEYNFCIFLLEDMRDQLRDTDDYWRLP